MIFKVDAESGSQYSIPMITPNRKVNEMSSKQIQPVSIKWYWDLESAHIKIDIQVWSRRIVIRNYRQELGGLM